MVKKDGISSKCCSSSRMKRPRSVAYYYSVAVLMLMMSPGGVRCFTSSADSYNGNRYGQRQFSTTGSTTKNHSGRSLASLWSKKEGANQETEEKEAASKELERMRLHLEKMSSAANVQQQGSGDGNDPQFQELYQAYISQPANALKEKLAALRLKSTGRKPELATRLVDYELKQRRTDQGEDDDIAGSLESAVAPASSASAAPLTSFASLSPLSVTAGTALAAAGIVEPTPIQAVAVPHIAGTGDHCILHAETGSGKTLAYLLPITEHLLRSSTGLGGDTETLLLLTPTRELASQVAGVAQVLCGQHDDVHVRLVTSPTDLTDDSGRGLAERGEVANFGGRQDRRGVSAGVSGRIVVGSAKAVMTSLYGDGKAPAAPTPKPAAKAFLRSVRWLVLDEVDRLLNIPKTRLEKKKFAQKKHDHEKPAAIITAAVTRLTLSQTQIIACSATVGRPMRRELARVLGLPSQECPEVLRGASTGTTTTPTTTDDPHVGRLVTIPSTVENYVLPCDGSTSGSLLTTASFVAKGLRGKRILLVLSKGCGLTIRDTIGALRHFNAHGNPRSLSDALEGGDNDENIGAIGGGTDRLIQLHRQVSRATGVGRIGSDDDEAGEADEGYLLVTGEDSVRGLHLDGLEVVIVVGRPHGPDEYTHIAGRTGRAGRMGGKVVNVVSYEQAAALTSWERMLGIDFIPMDMGEVSSVLL